jgi:hypothetical protein
VSCTVNITCILGARELRISNITWARVTRSSARWAWSFDRLFRSPREFRKTCLALKRNDGTQHYSNVAVRERAELQLTARFNQPFLSIAANPSA